MMPEAGSTPWMVVLYGAVPSVVGVVGVALKVWYERGTKRVVSDLTRGEQLMRDMDARIINAAKIDADLIAQGRAEIIRLIGRSERAEIRSDRLDAEMNRWRDLALWWNRKTHDIWHMWANKAQVVDEALRKAELPVVEWPKLNLPQVEDPFPPEPPR